MDVSVVIPTHNRADVLARTLSHLAVQDFDGAWEVIVIDNNCTDHTADVVGGCAFPVALRLLREAKPGPSAARNTGARAAAADHVLVVDDDILAAPSLVRLHVETWSAYPEHWLVGQIDSLPEQRLTPFGRYRRRLHPPANPALPPFEIDWFASNNASISRTELLELGGYNEAFETAALEDPDLALRARRHGVRLLYVPAIVGIHNDWAGYSVVDYCERQRIYCRSAVLLEERFGDDNPRSEVVRRNSPPAVGKEPLATTANKMVKALVSTRPVSQVLFKLAWLLERNRLTWPLLPRLYHVLIASWMYRGVRETT